MKSHNHISQKHKH